MLKHLSNLIPFVPWLEGASAAIVITGRPDISKYGFRMRQFPVDLFG